MKNKKLKLLFVILCSICLILQPMPISAAITYKNLDHVDVYVYGSITVITRVDGNVTTSVDTKLKITSLKAEVTEDGKTSTYASGWTTRTQTSSGAYSGEQEWHRNVTRFSKNAVITLSGTMYSAETETSRDFSITFSGDEIEKAVNQCPGRSGCDFILKEETVTDLFTHTVTFKTETGGTIDGGTDDVVYSGLMDKVDFPKVPTTDEDDDYEFLGWYDEDGNLVTSWPEKVTKDMVFTAKWEKKPQPTVVPTVEPTIEPSVEPTVEPTIEPSVEPSVEPTDVPTVEPSVEPTDVPTVEPTVEPTEVPTVEPTVVPTITPTTEPTVVPIIVPTTEPTVEPSVAPTIVPSAGPTVAPSVEPTVVPSIEPTVIPTEEPTAIPTAEITSEPIVEPTPKSIPKPTVKPKKKNKDPRVTVTIEDNDTVIINNNLIIKDEGEKDKENDNTPKIVAKTGDESKIELVIIIGIFSAAVLLYLIKKLLLKRDDK